jgi:ribosome biogenesis protein NSA2
LEILGVKKNPQSTVYTTLGVITKGTVIEVRGRDGRPYCVQAGRRVTGVFVQVNVSELGLITNTGKVVWGAFSTPCPFIKIVGREEVWWRRQICTSDQQPRK